MAIAFMPEKEVAPGDVSPRTARLLELIEEANAGVAGAPPPTAAYCQQPFVPQL